VVLGGRKANFAFPTVSVARIAGKKPLARNSSLGHYC
jgi:hypothetical protein